MSYFLDTADGTVYFATVVLTAVEDLSAPPMVVRLYDLLAEERFLEVEKGSINQRTI